MGSDRASSVWPLSPAEFGGALFTREDGAPGQDRYRATEYCRGPWSPDTLHGGPVVGLLAFGAENVATTEAGGARRCTRLTVEIHQPVPLDVLALETRVVKPGRRSMVIDSTIRHAGQTVARATSHWVDGSDEPTPTPSATPPSRTGLPRTGLSRTGPSRTGEAERPRDSGLFDYPSPGFNCDTAELRYVSGSHEESGPGVSWVRLVSPLIDGADNSPFVMAATVSDLAAAAGWETAPSGNNYINPDLTLSLARLPIGPWLGLDAHVVHGGAGAAMLTCHVFDDHGQIGHITQSMVEIPAHFDMLISPPTTS